MKRVGFGLIIGMMICWMSHGVEADHVLEPTGWTACPDELEATASTDADPPTLIPETPCGEWGSHYVFKRDPEGNVLPVLVEGPREGQVRSTRSYQQLKALLASGRPIPPELHMSRRELKTLVKQLNLVRASTEKYRDINAALADGFVVAKDVNKGRPGHFFHRARLNDGTFSPAEPEMLMYQQDENGRWQFTGAVVYMLYRRQVGDRHPDGFVGPLDNWHMHYNTCENVRVGAAAPDTCKALGGLTLHDFGWMLHVWVLEDNPLGVFSFKGPPGKAGTGHHH